MLAFGNRTNFAQRCSYTMHQAKKDLWTNTDHVATAQPAQYDLRAPLFTDKSIRPNFKKKLTVNLSDLELHCPHLCDVAYTRHFMRTQRCGLYCKTQWESGSLIWRYMVCIYVKDLFFMGRQVCKQTMNPNLATTPLNTNEQETLQQQLPSETEPTSLYYFLKDDIIIMRNLMVTCVWLLLRLSDILPFQSVVANIGCIG